MITYGILKYVLKLMSIDDSSNYLNSWGSSKGVWSSLVYLSYSSRYVVQFAWAIIQLSLVWSNYY